MNWQLFDAFGIFLGFTANLILSGTGDSSWRYQLASTSLPALCLLTLVWTIPESPRWLLKKGRYADAYASLVALRPTPLQAAAELFYAEAQIQAELNLLPRREPDPEAIPKDEQDGSPACSEPRRREKHEAREHEDPDTGCLSLRGRIQRAWNILTDQNNDADLDQYQRCAKSTFWFTRIWQLFRIKRNRRATIAALVVNLSQQLCGM